MAQWTYSDWITHAIGSSTRVERLRLHIQEVSDKLASGNFSVQGKGHDYDNVASYLDGLRASEAREVAAVRTASATFVKGVARR